MSLVPLPLIHTLSETRKECAAARAVLSGDAVHVTDEKRAELVGVARDLAAIEHAIAKVLGTTPAESKRCTNCRAPLRPAAEGVCERCWCLLHPEDPREPR